MNQVGADPESVVVEALRREVNGALAGWADAHLDGAGLLAQATRQALLSPGKRVRPILMLLVGRLYRVPSERLLDLSLVVELLHAASLALDDLPSMDDAETRRGQPSLHRRYGEAAAILAAFELLSLAHAFLPSALQRARIPRRRWIEAEVELASVVDSLCQGQTLDLAGAATSVEDLERVHARKTGALFELSARWGAYAGRATATEQGAVEEFARNLGLAFQVVDDVLDVSGDPNRLGKPIGQDAGRVTFVDVLGLDGARRLARELATTAADALDLFAERGAVLRAFAERVVSRDA